ncbi:MAG TPA: hypothetical protein PLF37_14600, partial [Planctomycetota bacterium]|nr:hypothetical protein [Planctomycetota bacterium]
GPLNQGVPMANGENCPGCADKAAPISGGNRLVAFKPLGERGPTVYRDMTGIAPEHMVRLNGFHAAIQSAEVDSERSSVLTGLLGTVAPSVYNRNSTIQEHTGFGCIEFAGSPPFTEDIPKALFDPASVGPPGPTYGDAQPLKRTGIKGSRTFPVSDTVNPPQQGEAGAESCTWKRSYAGHVSLRKSISMDVWWTYEWTFGRDFSKQSTALADSTQETVLGEQVEKSNVSAQAWWNSLVASGYLPPSDKSMPGSSVDWGDIIFEMEQSVQFDRSRPNPCSPPCPNRRVELVDYSFSHTVWHRNILPLSGKWSYLLRRSPDGTHELVLFRSVGKRVILQPELHFDVTYNLWCE